MFVIEGDIRLDQHSESKLENIVELLGFSIYCKLSRLLDVTLFLSFYILQIVSIIGCDIVLILVQN